MAARHDEKERVMAGVEAYIQPSMLVGALKYTFPLSFVVISIDTSNPIEGCEDKEDRAR